MNIIDFIRDPELIGGDLSDRQEAFLRLLYGLPLTRKLKKIAREALGRADLPPRRVYPEAAAIAGRRSGKSDRLGRQYRGLRGGHERHLTPGERGTILVLAQDKRAAQVVFRYIRAKFDRSALPTSATF